MTSMLVLCATLLSLWAGTMLIWLYSDKPLVSVTIQIVNARDQVPQVVRRAYAAG